MVAEENEEVEENEKWRLEFFLLFIYLFIFCMHPMEEMIEEMTQLDFIGEESVWKLWKMIYFSNLHKKE